MGKLSIRKQSSFQVNLENIMEGLAKSLTEITCNSNLPNLQSFQPEICQCYVFLFLLFFAKPCCCNIISC